MKSNCCHADAYVSSAEEGTNCWICRKCGKPCDAVKEMKTKEDVLASILDCSDHSMDGTRILAILAEFEKQTLERVRLHSYGYNYIAGLRMWIDEELSKLKAE